MPFISRFRKLFDIYKRENMICIECGKQLKPLCNAKQRDDKIYCPTCHWDLFGKKEMQERFKKERDFE